MINPVCNIIINDDLKIKGCFSFSVDKDIENLSVKGKVELPLYAIYKKDTGTEKLSLTDEIKEGYPIVIHAGYAEDELQTPFIGFVTMIQKGLKLTLEVEDGIYQLRKTPIVINENNIDLKDLVELLCDGTDIVISDKTNSLKIDTFRFKGNAAGALAKLKESLSLSIYFDDNNELYAGGQQLNAKGKIKAIYGRNIVKNQAKYQTKEANPVQIKVIGKKPDNTEVSVVAGMEGGSQYTFYRYNITDESALKSIAEEYLAKYSFDGFTGNFEMLFIPYAVPGGSVEYENKNYEDEPGTYLIKGVKYELTENKGLTQIIKLGAKLS
jgi:hypothetical protein